MNSSYNIFWATKYQGICGISETEKFYSRSCRETTRRKTVYKWQLIVNKKSKYWHDANERTYLPNALDDHAVLLKVNMSFALRKSVFQQTDHPFTSQFDIPMGHPYLHKWKFSKIYEKETRLFKKRRKSPMTLHHTDFRHPAKSSSSLTLNFRAVYNSILSMEQRLPTRSDRVFEKSSLKVIGCSVTCEPQNGSFQFSLRYLLMAWTLGS